GGVQLLPSRLPRALRGDRAGGRRARSLRQPLRGLAVADPPPLTRGSRDRARRRRHRRGRRLDHGPGGTTGQLHPHRTRRRREDHRDRGLARRRGHGDDRGRAAGHALAARLPGREGPAARVMTDRLDSTGYYALGIPAYLVLLAVEYRWARRRGRPGYRCAPTLGTLSTGLGEVVIGLFLGPALVGLYDWAFTRGALVRWPEHS